MRQTVYAQNSTSTDRAVRLFIGVLSAAVTECSRSRFSKYNTNAIQHKTATSVLCGNSIIMQSQRGKSYYVLSTVAFLLFDISKLSVMFSVSTTNTSFRKHKKSNKRTKISYNVNSLKPTPKFQFLS